MNLDCSRSRLLISFAIGNRAIDEPYLRSEPFRLRFLLDNVVNRLSPMHRRRHLSEKSSRCNIIRSREAVGAEINTIGLEPRIEGRVAFQLPEWFRRVDADVETDGRRLTLVGCSVGVRDRRHILVDTIACGNVSFLGERDSVGGVIDGEEVVVRVDFLEML